MVIGNNERLMSMHQILIYIGYYGLINISIFYINYTLLMPQLVQERKKYGLYIFSILLLIVFMGILKTLLAVLNPEIILKRTGKKGMQKFRNI